jgi:hypothetical protein
VVDLFQPIRTDHSTRNTPRQKASQENTIIRNQATLLCKMDGENKDQVQSPIPVFTTTTTKWTPRIHKIHIVLTKLFFLRFSQYTRHFFSKWRLKPQPPHQRDACQLHLDFIQKKDWPRANVAKLKPPLNIYKPDNR